MTTSPAGHETRDQAGRGPPEVRAVAAGRGGGIGPRAGARQVGPGGVPAIHESALRLLRHEPESAYALFPHAHGRGYATEVAGAVPDAAVATGPKRLWSTVGAWNTPLPGFLVKLGFERDHVSTEDNGEVVWFTHSLA
ncbi:GNAT family N-acetyltransferase [Streptomyces halstedii]|uniref:GNAT family N-acetyltransferase n=3 Tax=Streptomyces TaxID=1883 RepID=UPI00215651AB